VILVHILCLDDCFATTIMPQPTEITQFIFGRPLRDDVTLIVERHVDGGGSYSCGCFGSLRSPDPILVFCQTGNVGVAGGLNAGFRLGLSKAVGPSGRCSRIVSIGICKSRGTGMGICCGCRVLCNSTMPAERTRSGSTRWCAPACAASPLRWPRATPISATSPAPMRN
jgi:hypothetical protein